MRFAAPSGETALTMESGEQAESAPASSRMAAMDRVMAARVMGRVYRADPGHRARQQSARQGSDMLLMQHTRDDFWFPDNIVLS
ncbi:hypothetical protein MASSI9I_90697 [Massilia sp. 9I]|nr:hypothetical protein MASSI9I_90697 [Massilia sp. 9I]